jgi:hypothetical protein
MVVASPVLLLLLITFGGVALGLNVGRNDDRASGSNTSEESSTTTREKSKEATDGQETTATSEKSTSRATTSSGKASTSKDEEEATSESTSKQKEGKPPDILVDGAEDQTNGPLTDHRLVSYYGHPLSGAMGVLGQYGNPQDMMADLKKQANAYTELTPQRPAIPTIELIASVAQPNPGENGLYLRKTSKETIEKYAKGGRGKRRPAATGRPDRLLHHSRGGGGDKAFS